ncbi:MAG: hypothetical protein KGL53_04945, partial [Elusimicrobia bacterium]|nr:hypothetical protein [Elusimicrobiota bacterium]
AAVLCGAGSASATGAWLWLLAGSSAALALERGSGLVRALPLPLPPGARRVLMLPLAAALAAGLLPPARYLLQQLELNRGVFLEEQGRPEPALDIYSHMDSSGLAGLQALLRSARLDLATEGMAAAQTAQAPLDRLLSAAGPFGDSEFLRGEAERRLGHWESAESAYAAYAVQAPDDPRPYHPLADVRQTLGHPGDAVAAARALVRLTPQDPAAWRFLGEQVHTVDPHASLAFFAKADSIEALARGPGAPRIQP